MSDKLTPKERDMMVEKIIEIVRDYYTFPEIGEKIAMHIQDKMEKGRYSHFDKMREFCSVLTKDMHEVNRDPHLGVFYFPKIAARLRSVPPEEEGDPDAWFDRYQLDNFGLVKAEYLEGNVGYLDIRIFAPLSRAKESVIHAMNFLSNCDALILDVRNNTGGDPYLVQLIESYLFEGRPKLLLTLYQRSSDSYEQIYTIPHLPGKHLPSIPVYILTSRRTFSGAEDLAYTLKHHGRALTVGETTEGGANMDEYKVVHGNVVIKIPTGHPIHPLTGTNWEGVGVEPDISVPHEEALKAAHIHAIETLIAKNPGEERVRRLKWELERVEAIYTPRDIPKETLSKYVGTFGDYTVAFGKNTLILSNTRDEAEQWNLIPISEVLFALENNNDYNVRFDIEKTGKVTALVFLRWNQDRENPISRSNE